MAHSEEIFDAGYLGKMNIVWVEPFGYVYEHIENPK